MTLMLTPPRRDSESPSVALTGIGQALGSRLIPNRELAALTGIDEAAILHLTGIRTRSFAPFGDETDLAVRAVEDLFSRTGGPRIPDLLLVGTTTPSCPLPSTAMRLQGRLFPENGPPALDVGGSCAAFLTGLFLARAQILSGQAKEVLLVNCEQKSRHVCPVHSPDTALLFGDAATAVWLSGGPGPSAGPGLRVRSVKIGADGRQARLITYRDDPESRRKILRMEGPALFRRAVRTLARETRALLHDHGLTQGEIEAFIFHQANGRILDGVAREAGIPEHRLPRTVALHGNTSSASLGITLNHFLAGKGDRGAEGPVVLGAIGGGITWGIALLEPDGRSSYSSSCPSPEP